MYVLEFGQRKGVLLNGDNDTFTYYPNYEAVLSVPVDIPDGSELTIEYSHMGVAKTEDEKKQSKAVIYTKEQLRKFYDDCVEHHIDFRLFPQQMTYDARKYAGYEDDKSEENDARSIHKWLTDFPECWGALKRPPKSFDTRDIVEEGWRVRDIVSDILNRLRDEFTIPKGQGNLAWYKNPKLPAYQFINKHIDELVEQIEKDSFREALGLNETHKNNPNKVRMGAIKRQPISTLYHTLVDIDGNLIIREDTGTLPGKKFFQQHICPHKPYSRRGGVCRSNIYYWGLHKGWLQSKIAAMKGATYVKAPSLYTLTKDEKAQVNMWRQQYINAIDKMYAVIKKIVEREHSL